MKIGIDGHAWVHQVLPMVATDLYYGNPTDKHARMFMNKINALLNYKITPIVIFDGDSLPSKEKTNLARKEQKEKARKMVEFLLEHNETSKAKEYMKRCVSVTPEILKSIFSILQANKIEYIISPYEADSQLYFLQKINYIDYIITEDSDLIIYGATRILYKFSGSHVEEYNSKDLHLCKDMFFKNNILDICILSGCDYLDSIKGVGLITAHNKLQEIGSVAGFVNYMRSIGKNVPENYLENFNCAKLAFLHHIVYNPFSSERQYLTEPNEDYKFLGTTINLPFRCANLIFDRHYLPISKSTLILEDKKDLMPEDGISKFDLYSELESPYFK